MTTVTNIPTFPTDISRTQRDQEFFCRLRIIQLSESFLRVRPPDKMGLSSLRKKERNKEILLIIQEEEALWEDFILKKNVTEKESICVEDSTKSKS